jgi:hypothetical protein
LKNLQKAFVAGVPTVSSTRQAGHLAIELLLG